MPEDHLDDNENFGDAVLGMAVVLVLEAQSSSDSYLYAGSGSESKQDRAAQDDAELDLYSGVGGAAGLFAGIVAGSSSTWLIEVLLRLVTLVELPDPFLLCPAKIAEARLHCDPQPALADVDLFTHSKQALKVASGTFLCKYGQTWPLCKCASVCSIQLVGMAGNKPPRSC